MPSFRTRRQVAFSADQMLALVADVERYPEFLPLCTALRVTERRVHENGEDLVARMSVGYKAISESFTTRVGVRPKERRIDVAYVDGPFRRLDNVWTFTDAPGGSIVDFAIDYEFRSPLLAVVVGGMFDQAFRRFADAFEERARVVYGSAGASSPA